MMKKERLRIADNNYPACLVELREGRTTKFFCEFEPYYE